MARSRGGGKQARELRLSVRGRIRVGFGGIEVV